MNVHDFVAESQGCSDSMSDHIKENESKNNKAEPKSAGGGMIIMEEELQIDSISFEIF